MRPAVSIITPKRAGDKLIVSSFYHGTLCLKLDKDKPAATVAWRSKNSYPKPIDGLNAVMTSLLVKDEHVYGIAGMGELICQKLDTGEVVRTGDEIFGEKAAFCGSVFWVDAGEAGLRPDRPGRPRRAEAHAGEVRGAGMRARPGNDARREGTQGGLGAPGVRRQARLHEERQGDRLRVARVRVIR